MAFKRVTVEFHDTPDTDRATTVPEPLRASTPVDLKSKDLTNLPSEEEGETTSPITGEAPPRRIGRTVSDLFVEFKDDGRVVGTLLMFAPFVPFVIKIEEFGDLLYPFTVGVLLNVMWFGIGFIRYLKRRYCDT